MTVGQRVLAVHPKTGELKTGSILTAEISKFDVRFDNLDLGIALIKDYNLVPIGESIFILVHEIELEPQPGEPVPDPKSTSYLARQRSTKLKHN